MMMSIQLDRSNHVAAAPPTTMPDDHASIDAERRYLTQRASGELRATLNAAGIEAEIAHNMLTRAYLARCNACAEARTTMCLDCRFEHVCNAAVGDAAIVHADRIWPSSPARVTAVAN